VKDGLSGGPFLLGDDELNKVLKVFMAEQKMKAAERRKKFAEQKAKQRQSTTPAGSDPPLNRDVPENSR